LLSALFKVGSGVVPVLAPIRDAVSGNKVVIDPGHGGIDGGAVGKNGLIEKDVNLDISKELELLLNRNAVYTVMTRDTDKDLIEPDEYIMGSRKREELNRRIQIVSESGADLFISIHANSFSKPQWSGAQVFYRDGCEESKRLAETIQAELVSQLGPNTRKAKTADLYILNNVNIPAVLIEVGFLSNLKEEQLLADSSYRQKVAQVICKGINNYLIDAYECKENDDISNYIEDKLVVSDSFASDIKIAQSEIIPAKKDEVTLYFGSSSDYKTYLTAEKRSILKFSEMENLEKANAILLELIKGPEQNSTCSPTIPTGTLIRDIKLDNDVISVNFSRELVENHWGGTMGENVTIYSIVNSLTELSFINKVKILVDDKELDTIAGHVQTEGTLMRKLY